MTGSNTVYNKMVKKKWSESRTSLDLPEASALLLAANDHGHNLCWLKGKIKCRLMLSKENSCPNIYRGQLTDLLPCHLATLHIQSLCLKLPT